jgi:hypothetical protein
VSGAFSGSVDPEPSNVTVSGAGPELRSTVMRAIGEREPEV